MFTRAQKADQIASIAKQFGKAKAAILVYFKGMKVEQVTELRKQLRPVDAEMRVVRNTLAKLALQDFPEIKEALADDFVGTNAVVFAYNNDVSAPAKTLAEFGKKVPHLELKTAVMEGKKLDQNKIKFLATLPAKDVLRAQLLGLFAAPATQFVRLCNEVPSSFVRTLNAYKEKKSE